MYPLNSIRQRVNSRSRSIDGNRNLRSLPMVLAAIDRWIGRPFDAPSDRGLIFPQRVCGRNADLGGTGTIRRRRWRNIAHTTFARPFTGGPNVCKYVLSIAQATSRRRHGRRCAALTLATSAESRVTRIVVDATVPIAGQPYQQLTGRAFGELDPNDTHNALITDLNLAPLNASGKAEYIASFRLRIPTNLNLASGVMCA